MFSWFVDLSFIVLLLVFTWYQYKNNLTWGHVRIAYPIELLTPIVGSDFEAHNVSSNSLTCFSNRDYSPPTYRESLMCLLFIPGASCHSIWGSRAVKVEVNGSVEFLKLNQLPQESFPSEHTFLSADRWLQVSSLNQDHHTREIKVMPAEPVYLCARSTDWKEMNSQFRVSFRSGFIREKDKDLCINRFVLHLVMVIAVGSAWLLPYLASVVVGFVSYHHIIRYQIITTSFCVCIVGLTPIMLMKRNRNKAMHYFLYFFTRKHAEETRQVIRQNTPIFQALFFSSASVCIGSAMSYILYSYGYLDRNYRNILLQLTFSMSISWCVFAICRSLEKVFREYAWILLVVGLQSLLDHTLNPQCRDEVFSVIIVLSFVMKLFSFQITSSTSNWIQSSYNIDSISKSDELTHLARNYPVSASSGSHSSSNRQNSVAVSKRKGQMEPRGSDLTLKCVENGKVEEFFSFSNCEIFSSKGSKLQISLSMMTLNDFLSRKLNFDLPLNSLNEKDICMIHHSLGSLGFDSSQKSLEFLQYSSFCENCTKITGYFDIYVDGNYLEKDKHRIEGTKLTQLFENECVHFLQEMEFHGCKCEIRFEYSSVLRWKAHVDISMDAQRDSLYSIQCKWKNGFDSLLGNLRSNLLRISENILHLEGSFRNFVVSHGLTLFTNIRIDKKKVDMSLDCNVIEFLRSGAVLASNSTILKSCASLSITKNVILSWILLMGIKNPLLFLDELEWKLSLLAPSSQDHSLSDSYTLSLSIPFYLYSNDISLRNSNSCYDALIALNTCFSSIPNSIEKDIDDMKDPQVSNDAPMRIFSLLLLISNLGDFLSSSTAKSIMSSQSFDE